MEQDIELDFGTESDFDLDFGEHEELNAMVRSARDQFDDLLEEDAENPIASGSQLSELSAVVKGYFQLTNRIAETESLLKELKKNKEQLETTTIPDLMTACQASSHTTDDGLVVEVKDIVAGSIRVDNRPKAFEWLRENGHGWLIKNTIKIDLAQHTEELASRLMLGFKKLSENPEFEGKMSYEQEEAVHAGSLGKWAREELEKDTKLPTELLGIYVGKRATVKKESAKTKTKKPRE